MESRTRAFLDGAGAGANNKNYKNGSQEPGSRPFLEGAEAKSRELPKKEAGSPTLI